ncbi:hypothetical protein [Lichenifustis flavocetrariae]|uniref:Uncharacterized protein n=1 Tax=Lichenifustis flavocetrariae TaxID=2949735 RepID=A0AA41Z5R3_9HYPH|nr:hypothetical protein [Lichenifustis flavocetrariae]MCW6511003.1 hypothetical protein [Lichenifustis flavocetrariae]
MNPTLLKILLAAAGRSAEQGTLFDIIATAVKLARLIEPLLDQATNLDGIVQAPSEPARRDAP